MRMTRKVGLLVVAGLLSFAVQAGESPMRAMSAGECWTKAMNVGDVNAVAACYLPDAVMWFPGGRMVKGREATRKGYADYFAAYTIKDARLDDMGHVDAHDARTTWGTFKIEMVSRGDGKPVTERGRFTDVSRKVDGHWMYAVDHASDGPAPAAH